MASDLSDKITDLRIAQGETQTLIKSLAKRVDKYIINDDARHRDLLEFRLESSKHLATVTTIVKEMKREVDCAVDQSIPTLQKEQASQKATLKTHSWLIRAIVGVTLLAVLGGAVTTLTTCNPRHPEETEVSLTDVDTSGVR